VPSKPEGRNSEARRGGHYQLEQLHFAMNLQATIGGAVFYMMSDTQYLVKGKHAISFPEYI
jgi:hypothetical protein